MDDTLLAQFQSAMGGEVIDAQATHTHNTLYKQRRDGYGNQEARRKKMFELQRSRRRDFMDYSRKIVEGQVWEESEGECLMGEEALDEVDAKTEQGAMSMEEATKVKRKKRRYYPYQNQLMLSEWLVEVPADFEENWLMFVCPVGRRSLVISSKSTTNAYSRAGRCLNNFPSLLPGGCSKTHRLAKDYCILDCIYYEGTQTYYVLDIMCWGGHQVYDSDTEFRAFWKASKIKENTSKVSRFSRFNPLSFIDLPAYPCTKELITHVLSTKWPVLVDGLLFIHKEAHYCTYRSPLALWLKAHMVSDVLGIPVSPEFLECAPSLSNVTMDSVNSDGSNEQPSSGSTVANKKRKPKIEVMQVSSEPASIATPSEEFQYCTET